MSDTPKTIHEIREAAYQEHRAYIVQQRDRDDQTTYDRQGWQRMLLDLDRETGRLGDG